MFHILKNAENPHFYGFRLHTFRTTDKVIRYGINNQFDFAEHPAVIQRGEKRTINICVAVPVEFGAGATVGDSFVSCNGASETDICTGCDSAPLPLEGADTAASQL